MNSKNGHAKCEECTDVVSLEPLLCKNGGNDVIIVAVSAPEENRRDVTPNTAQTLETEFKDANQNRHETRSILGIIGGNKKRRQKVSFSTAPDGGWGWVVVLSSFTISMLVDGVCFSFGIFFDEFREEFATNKAATSWVGSVLNGTYLVIGPIVSALVNIYGCRAVALSGAVLAAVAFFVSTFSKSLSMLILTYGFMAGFGFGLMYLPAIVMVGYYFERRRALATGIACCGSGIGAFVFAPFSEYLIYEYGWRGATWIISALVLNGFVFALFYRPLPESAGSLAIGESTDSATSVLSASELVDDNTEMDQSQIQSLTGEKKQERDCGKPPMSGLFSRAVDKHAELSATLRDRILDALGQGSKLSSSHRARSVVLDEDSQPQDLTRLARSTDLNFLWHRKRRDSTGVDGASGSVVTTENSGPFLNPLLKKDIFYSGSLIHLKDHRVQGHPVHNQSKLHHVQDMSANHSAIDDLSFSTASATESKSFSQALSRIFDLSLLKSPTFLIYGTSCFLCMAGFFVPFIYMPTHATDLGLDSWFASSLISIIGITNTGGRIVVGYVSDKPWADCLLINNVALIIGGSATMFVPYLPNYILLASYASVFGLAIAVFVSLRSIIMVELMGLERLTTAFGLVIMCQGMSAFLGAPIAGFLSDTYGNYDAAFYLAGVSLALSGIICIPLRRIARWEGARYGQKASNCVIDTCENDEDSPWLDKKTTASKYTPEIHLDTIDIVDLSMTESVVDTKNL